MSIIDNHLDLLVLGDREFCSGSHISHLVSEVSKVLIGFHLFLGDLHNGWTHLDAMAKLGDKRESTSLKLWVSATGRLVIQIRASPVRD